MIDTTFDFRTDATTDDPDQSSPTLRRYHRQLWSKPLPSGDIFDLVETTPRVYLHHRSILGEFFLASDSVIPTFTRYVEVRPITDQLPEDEHEAFRTIGYTIGGMMVFPANKVDNKLTLNGARGLYPRIADRMDLTLECIRRHYAGAYNPLEEVLQRYRDFFALFENFTGYVEHFLLQDLVTDEGSVKFFTPFDDFSTPALPRDLETYREYRRRSIDFINARNVRIDKWAREHLTPEPAAGPTDNHSADVGRGQASTRS